MTKATKTKAPYRAPVINTTGTVVGFTTVDYDGRPHRVVLVRNKHLTPEEAAVFATSFRDSNTHIRNMYFVYEVDSAVINTAWDHDTRDSQWATVAIDTALNA